MLTNETEIFREKHVSVTLCSSQIPYGLAWGRIRASALTYVILTSMYDLHNLSCHLPSQVQIPTTFFCINISVLSVATFLIFDTKLFHKIYVIGPQFLRYLLPLNYKLYIDVARSGCCSFTDYKNTTK